MNINILRVVMGLIPTTYLAYVLIQNKFSGSKKLTLILGFAMMIFLDAVNIYLVFTKQPIAASAKATSVGLNTEQDSLTRACQTFQTDAIIKLKPGIEQPEKSRIENAVLLTCRCITLAIHGKPEYSAIEEAAAHGAGFLKLMSEHQELFTEVMSQCAKAAK